MTRFRRPTMSRISVHLTDEVRLSGSRDEAANNCVRKTGGVQIDEANAKISFRFVRSSKLDRRSERCLDSEASTVVCVEFSKLAILLVRIR